MRRSRRIAFLASAALIPLSALAVTACGGAAATASRPASTSTPTAKTSSAASATVGVCEQRPRVDPGRLSRQDPVPVAGRHRAEEHLQRRLCRGLASALDHRGADRRQRRESVTARHHQALGRDGAGDLQPASALPLHGGYRVRPDHRTRLHRFRRAVVRALPRRQQDHRFGVHEWPGERIEFVQWLLVRRASTGMPASTRSCQSRSNSPAKGRKP